MNQYFTYSLLQYKHSLTLGESINVGILFHFSDGGVLKFVHGTGSRLKAIYHDFNSNLFNSYLDLISARIGDVSFSVGSKYSLKEFISKEILSEDETALQFLPPVNVINAFKSNEEAIDAYSRLLIPGILDNHKGATTKRNESFILNQYKNLIFHRHKDLESKFKRNEIIRANGLSYKFELAWRNGTTNLIKPISFDLSTEQAIQDKSTQVYGTINLLGDFAGEHDYRFDLLISKPQNRSLLPAYENAIVTLEKAQAPKKVITEEELGKYSEKTIKELLAH